MSHPGATGNIATEDCAYLHQNKADSTKVLRFRYGYYLSILDTVVTSYRAMA